MKCDNCGKSIDEVGVLFRQNEKGIPGIFYCAECDETPEYKVLQDYHGAQDTSGSFQYLHCGACGTLQKVNNNVTKWVCNNAKCNAVNTRKPS